MSRTVFSSQWERCSPLSLLVDCFFLTVILVLQSVFRVFKDTAESGFGDLWQRFVDHVSDKETLFFLGLGLLGYLLLAFYSLWFWFYQRFWIDEGCFHYRKGRFFKTNRVIPYDKIQSVEVSATFSARVFGLRTVELETIGKIDSKVKLSYLRTARANDLRDRIRSAQRRHLAISTQSGCETDSVLGSAAMSPSTGRIQTAALSWQGTTGQVCSFSDAAPGATALSVPLSTAAQEGRSRLAAEKGPEQPETEMQAVAEKSPEQPGDKSHSDLGESPDLGETVSCLPVDPVPDRVGVAEADGLQMAEESEDPEVKLFAIDNRKVTGAELLHFRTLKAILFLAIWALGSIWLGKLLDSAVSMYTIAFVALGTVYSRFKLIYSAWNCALFLHHDQLVFRQRTASLRTSRINLDRIHAVRVIQPLFWRIWDWYRGAILVAGRQIELENSMQAEEVVSVGSFLDVLTLAEAALPDLGMANNRQAITQALLGGGQTTWYRMSPKLRWRFPIKYWTFAFCASQQGIVVQQGFFTKEIYLIPFTKVQSVKLVAGPIMRRLGTAAIWIELVHAPGWNRIELPGFDLGKAQELYSYLVQVTMDNLRPLGADRLPTMRELHKAESAQV